MKSSVGTQISWDYPFNSVDPNLDKAISVLQFWKIYYNIKVHRMREQFSIILNQNIFTATFNTVKDFV